MDSGSSSDSTRQRILEKRLDSWKEIATYLRRCVRTARLWEKNESLPVHRHFHNLRGSIYAFPSELDSWWNNRSPQPHPNAKPMMLAVLPFQNLSGDPEQEYFSDGLTEEMIVRLSRLHPQQLRVVARTSAMHYKGTKKSTRQIARELGVNYILEGSVRRSGNRVRITACLVHVGDQVQRWAECYEHHLIDVFAIQSNVAQKIARSLEVELLPCFSIRGGSGATADPEAYEAYLKGRYHWNRRNQESLKRGISYFQQAIEKDPSYALPYSGLADSFLLLGFYGIDDPLTTGVRAKQATTKALELDDTLGEAHTSLAELKAFHEWDWAGAEKEYRRGVELSPSYATAYHWYANYLAVVGRNREALHECQRALEIDPISPILNVWMGMISQYDGLYNSMISHCERALEIDPDYALAHWGLGLAYEQCGRFKEAIREMQKVAALFSESTLMTAELGRVFAVSGDRNKAQEILTVLEQMVGKRYISSYHMAGILAALERTDLAFDWLRQTQEERSPWLANIRRDARMNGLRADPRFDEFLSVTGLSHA